jgi:acetate---CoA ligase (ADP-forming)
MTSFAVLAQGGDPLEPPPVLAQAGDPLEPSPVPGLAEPADATAQSDPAGTGPASFPSEPASTRTGLLAMLEARSVALVGASPRPGTFGRRMAEEAAKSASQPRIYPVNPKYAELDGRPCFRSLADLPEAVDLALLAVPDAALEDQLSLAAEVGARSAVVFGSAHERRERVVTIANSARMALCGAGCMGFINVSRGLRAIGYTEADPVPDGPVALVTHSGSVFSALLRARRRLGFTLAVSSGQELVTSAPAYLEYALGLPETRVLALVLEAIRDGAALRRVLARAAERDIPVVLLTTGNSAVGREMVTAHSGALAAADGGWEALARAYGVHRVNDLAELTDTLELFVAGRRAVFASTGPGTGIATVHDSGLERTHVADMAAELGVPFAAIGPATAARLSERLDPGLIPANPLDVWGTGAETRELFGGCLAALAADPAVGAVALAVDLVHELDGDDSYPLALLDVAAQTDKPLAVLSNLASAIDPGVAARLRGRGIAVLEGTRSGLLALRHVLDHARWRGRGGGTAAGASAAGASPGGVSGDGASADGVSADGVSGEGVSGGGVSGRRRRGAALLAAGEATGARLLGLLAEYGIGVARSVAVGDAAGALAAAEAIGYPVVLKTDEPTILHKSDAGGVLLGIADSEQLAAGYADLAARLGPRALVCESIPSGVELALGLARDAELGPFIVVGAGGVLVELLADRAVALPPVDAVTTADLLDGLRVRKLLAGVRGAAPADMNAVIAAITGLSALAVELGDELEALDVNPLICGPGGAVAVDALAIPRRRELVAGQAAAVDVEDLPRDVRR